VKVVNIGDLVQSTHERALRGIVMEIGPKETHSAHGRACARILWFDGEETIEFIKMLEVLSESR